VLSVVKRWKTGVETATIGREGMVGMPVFHGVSSTPEQVIVQVPARPTE